MKKDASLRLAFAESPANASTLLRIIVKANPPVSAACARQPIALDILTVFRYFL